MVAPRVRWQGSLRSVAMVTRDRGDGGRENVEKEEERGEDEDKRKAPVDGQLQRRHLLSQVIKKSLFILMLKSYSAAPHLAAGFP